MEKLRRTSITNRALFERVRRRLARDCEYLRTCREDSKWFDQHGRYYIVKAENGSGHWRSRTLVATDIDLEALGRELGVLRTHETVDAGPQ